MYVVTFYSFKGGVGRTMALVNVAMALAQAGRRVLMVDFDLEAPGIETFEAFRPPANQRGVVDFVRSYLETNQSPAVEGYLYERSDAAKDGGAIWLMPAGLRDAGYGARLGSIDWAHLYEHRDGYLLFEDLKAQWEATVKPDYVFVDSRTGFTDVGGICTRQLPDAVVFLFFPNEQNIRGLKRVVRDVRTENERRREPIELHFVTSNVPDLDDEDRILSDRIEGFRAELGYEKPSATIHHYNSLALLNQVVFTVERPRSRLATEYRSLLRAVVGRNLMDEEGAIEYLRRVLRGGKWAPNVEMLESLRILGKLEQYHSDSVDVLGRLAEVNERLGRVDDALRQTEAALHAPGSPEAGDIRRAELLIRRVRLIQQSGREAGPAALEEALRGFLDAKDAQPQEVFYALRQILRLDPAGLDAALVRPAYRSLSLAEQCSLLGEDPNGESLPLSRAIVTDILGQIAAGAEVAPPERHALSLHLIALRLFDEAQQIIAGAGADASGIASVFNAAMADWGKTGRPPVDSFERVLELDRSAVEPLEGPNFEQCLAIAAGAAGHRENGIDRLDRARVAAARPTLRRVGIFSAWRYLHVSSSLFLGDLDEMRVWIEGGDVVPPFMRPLGSEKE